MAPQYSTSLSDGVLAVSALYTAMALYPFSMFATLGFLMITVAACFGVVRFASDSPSDSLITRHMYMSQLASSLGLPLIAVTYLLQQWPFFAYIFLVISFGFFVLQRYIGDRAANRAAGEVISSVSMLAVLLQSILYFNPYAILGVVTFAFSALVIKTNGHFYSIPRVDLFHYAIMLACLLLKRGLEVSILPDIYYKVEAST